MSKSPETKRPLSPHLSIYRPQITSVLSITHRLTGIGLYFGLVLFSVWILMNAYGCGSCLNALLSTKFGVMILVLFNWALYYHLLNGIRHLVWDAGKGYQIKTVNISGWLVVILSMILVIATWILPTL
jgi:succinate dehydrogenase / fumarate reductase cytochrome b subunit